MNSGHRRTETGEFICHKSSYLHLFALVFVHILPFQAILFLSLSIAFCCQIPLFRPSVQSPSHSSPPKYQHRLHPAHLCRTTAESHGWCRCGTAVEKSYPSVHLESASDSTSPVGGDNGSRLHSCVGERHKVHFPLTVQLYLP